MKYSSRAALAALSLMLVSASALVPSVWGLRTDSQIRPKDADPNAWYPQEAFKYMEAQ